MIGIIIPTQYFPPISTFSSIYHGYDVLIEKYENYQKKSHRNRAYVTGPNGIQFISIPLQGGRNQTIITDIHISYDEDWVKSHLESLKTYYRSSPYYEFYIDEISNILNSEYQNLFELNSSILIYLLKALRIDARPKFTESYLIEYPNFTDLRRSSVSKYQNPLYSGKSYRQVFTDKVKFTPDLSILDLLFNHGPESIYYL